MLSLVQNTNSHLLDMDINDIDLESIETSDIFRAVDTPTVMPKLNKMFQQSRACTFVPISNAINNDTKYHFLFEMQEERIGRRPMYDGDRRSQAVEGDLFAFVYGNGKKQEDLLRDDCYGGLVHFRQVMAVLGPTARRTHWKDYDMASGRDSELRNTLVLGDVICVTTWEQTLSELNLYKEEGQFVNPWYQDRSANIRLKQLQKNICYTLRSTSRKQ